MAATKAAHEAARLGPGQQGRHLPSPPTQVEAETQRRRRRDGGKAVILIFSACRLQDVACGSVPAHSTPVHDDDL